MRKIRKNKTMASAVGLLVFASASSPSLRQGACGPATLDYWECVGICFMDAAGFGPEALCQGLS